MTKKAIAAMTKSGHEIAGRDEPSGEPYKVGYGNPPVETRFQKGISGNGKGRPKKNRKGFARQVADFMLETTTAGGRQITWLEALIARLRKSALDGDPRSIDYLFALEGTGIVTSNGSRLAENEFSEVLEADARQRADELFQDWERDHQSSRKPPSLEEILRPLHNADYEWKLLYPKQLTADEQSTRPE